MINGRTMLNSIYIDGFKNLKNLKIDLKPGLNVLVGPNGVGKSNILNANAFVSHFLESGLLDIRRSLGVRNISQLYYSEVKNTPKLDVDNHIMGTNETTKTMHFILEGSSVNKHSYISQEQDISKTKRNQ